MKSTYSLVKITILVNFIVLVYLSPLQQTRNSNYNDFFDRNKADEYSKTQLLDKIENLLDWLHLRVKHFVTQDSFSPREFQPLQHALRYQLKEIVDATRHVVLPTNILLKVKFALTMLRKMLDATYTILRYSGNGLDEVLLRKVSRLNIGLLALYNSNGTPDLLVDDYSDRVTRLVGALTLLSWVYNDMDFVPLRTKGLLEDQFREARGTLAALESHLQKEPGRSLDLESTGDSKFDIFPEAGRYIPLRG